MVANYSYMVHYHMLPNLRKAGFHIHNYKYLEILIFKYCISGRKADPCLHIIRHDSVAI